MYMSIHIQLISLLLLPYSTYHTALQVFVNLQLPLSFQQPLSFQAPAMGEAPLGETAIPVHSAPVLFKVLHTLHNYAHAHVVTSRHPIETSHAHVMHEFGSRFRCGSEIAS